jgi:hypothetical protein
MTEEKETPKSSKPREPVVMAEAIVTRELEFKEPRVMELAIEKIEKARKPDSH